MQLQPIKLDREATSQVQLQEAAIKHKTLSFEVSLEDFIWAELDYAGKIEVRHYESGRAELKAGPFRLIWRNKK